MHSPKSSLESNPSLAKTWNLASTCFHNKPGSDSPAAVLFFMNLSPPSALCALDLFLNILACAFIISRADTTAAWCRSSASDVDVLADTFPRHENIRRSLDPLRARKLPFVETDAGSSAAEIFRSSEVAGLKLHSTTESSSSSIVASTISSPRKFPLKSLR
ncbi:hypothetical protein OROMI_002328 [Orobanche minor]